MKKSALLLALVSLAACSSGPAVVTGISVAARPATVQPGGSTVVAAYVTGSGGFNLNANWQIVSGGGSLSATSGAYVEYTAPATPTVAVIRATTISVPALSSDLTLTVGGGATTAGR